MAELNPIEQQPIEQQRMTIQSEYANWNLKAKNLLVGRTVKNVGYMTREQADKLDLDFWYKLPLIIEFTDGTMITIASDDECNNGGAILVLNVNDPVPDTGILPTMYG